MQTFINQINKITIDQAISLGLVEMVGLKYPDSRGSMNIIGENLNNAAFKFTESHAGVLRGLHWQNLKSPQKKIISVGRGKVTLFLLKVNKVEPSKVLNAIEINENSGWFLIKENFAHGYLSMDDSIFYYLTQGQYDEQNEKVFSIRDIVMKEWDFLDIIASSKDT
tara:strand:- start:321 stop:818 length:498 start_codon:yes stop_codon:yes gene_type:complete